MVRTISILLLVGLFTGVNGQFANYQKAFRAYKEKKLDLALQYSDSSIASEYERKLPYVWHLRAFVLNEHFRIKDQRNPNSKFRPMAIEAFEKSMKLDSAGEFLDKNKRMILQLALGYFNDGAEALNDRKFEISQGYFDRYVELTKAYDKIQLNLKQNSMMYFNVVGAARSRVYQQYKSRANFDKVIEAYSKSISLDSNNYNANYNLGILYYNQGVDLILELDAETPLEKLIEVQDKCVRLFSKSLPYMKKAHELDPRNKETIVGLAGIYYNMNERKKSQFYDDMAAELEGSPKSTDEKAVAEALKQGKALESAGRYDEALRAYEAASSKFPNNKEIQAQIRKVKALIDQKR